MTEASEVLGYWRGHEADFCRFETRAPIYPNASKRSPAPTAERLPIRPRQTLADWTLAWPAGLYYGYMWILWMLPEEHL